MMDVNLTGEARKTYMETVAKKSVNLTEDERKAFMDALTRDSLQTTEAKQNRVYSQRGDDYLLEAQRVCGEDKREYDKPTPRCPYCGTPMVGEERIERAYWYKCYKCGATTPTEKTEQAAYKAAMQRWLEPNRVLTMEEVEDACNLEDESVLLWIEYNCNGKCTLAYQYCTVKETEEVIYLLKLYMDVEIEFKKSDYGKRWRCWLRKPTQKEMEAVPWEEEHAKD